MSFSFQLYSSRETASQEAFLARLADLGYTMVEGYGGVYGDAEGFSKALAANNLTMPSGHFAVADLQNNFDATMAIADTLGIKHIVGPFLQPDQRPNDTVGWTAFAKDLGVIADKVEATGKTFSWHNHEFEFEPLPDGKLPMDIILEVAPNVAWEADLGWVARAGLDPAPYIDTYADRIVSVHVKDIAAEGDCLDEDGWADVGKGVVDWAGLLPQIRAKAPNAILIAEHDKPSDVDRFAADSIANMKGM